MFEFPPGMPFKAYLLSGVWSNQPVIHHTFRLLTVQLRGPPTVLLYVLIHEAAWHLTSHSSSLPSLLWSSRSPVECSLFQPVWNLFPPWTSSPPPWLLHTGLTHWHKGPALSQCVPSVDSNLLLVKGLCYSVSTDVFRKCPRDEVIFWAEIWLIG